MTIRKNNLLYNVIGCSFLVVGLISLFIVCFISYYVMVNQKGGLPITLYVFYEIGIMGILLSLSGLFLIMGKGAFKYILFTLILGVYILVIDKFLIPTLVNVLDLWQYKELYRVVVGTSVLVIITSFLIVEDKLKSRFKED